MGVLQRFGEMYRKWRRGAIPPEIAKYAVEIWMSIPRAVRAIARSVKTPSGRTLCLAGSYLLQRAGEKSGGVPQYLNGQRSCFPFWR